MNSRIVALAVIVLMLLNPVFSAACGDGKCESAENSCNCPTDCGKCEGEVPHRLCREYGCVGEICKIIVIPDCCGNDICEESAGYYEDYGNCPADCTPKEVTIEFLSPLEGEYYMRGDVVHFKARIAADGRSIASPDVNLDGFFGLLELYNDGKHGDEKPYDSIFGNYLVIESNVNEGSHPIFARTAFRGVDGNTTIELEINAKFDIEVETGGEYALGDIIPIAGQIMRRGSPLQIEIDANLFFGNVLLFEDRVESDEDGRFSTFYHTSLIDSPGEWTLSISAVDANNNYIFYEKKIDVGMPSQTPPLNLELVEPIEESYSKGSSILFIVRVINDKGEIVEGATVEVEGPNGKIIALEELVRGKYSGLFNIDYTFPSETIEFTIRASKTEGSETRRASMHIETSVENLELVLEVLSPNKLSYAVGEQMEIRLRISYPNGDAVSNAKAEAMIGTNEINLIETEIGVYTGSYVVEEGYKEQIKVFFSADDGTGNTGIGTRDVEISGKVFWYDLMKNLFVLGVGFIILAIGAVISLIFILKRNKLVMLEKKKYEIEAMQKNLQRRYFDEDAINKEEFKELTDKYERQLKEINNEISRQRRNRQ